MSTTSSLLKGNLISKVDVSATSVKRNAPVNVAVTLLAGVDAKKTNVWINGQDGLRRFIQFPNKGTRKITVYAENGKTFDEREVTVTVTPLAANERHIPHLTVKRDAIDPYSAWIGIGNIARYTKATRQFRWGISDGRAFTSKATEAKISFKDSMDHSKPFTEFNLSAFETTDPLRQEGKQIIRIWSLYHFMKNSRSVLVPEASPIPLVWSEGPNLSLKVAVRNFESKALAINKVILEYLRPGSINQSAEKPVTIAFSVPANTSATFSYNILKSAVPIDAIGIQVNLFGPAANGLPAIQTSTVIDLPNSQVDAFVVKDPALLAEVKAMLGEGISSVSLDRIPDSILNAYKKTGALEKVKLRHMSAGANARGSAASVIGERCQPMDTPPIPNIYCALTTETEYILIPAQIMNARKGDVILSAGGPSGLIGGVLAAVTPPQQYSHSGIMTENYTEVRHSTASEKYLMDNLRSDSFANNNGFDPFKFKYMWPGTITQSVQNAFFGEKLLSPDGNGKEYSLTGFQHNSSYDTDLNIISAMVVKPSPMLEQPGNWIRPLLHAVADSAKQIKGHYRLFSYTDAAISVKPEFNAPALNPAGKTWWGANSIATVCSSLVWVAIQRLNWKTIGIEGEPGFLSFDDLEVQENNVAKVDPQTRDGLYLYDKDERFAAAQKLRSKIYEEIDKMASKELGDEAGAIVSGLFDVKDEVAYQVLNNFMQDNSNRVDGSTPGWYSSKNPGIGRAVSPDDILRFWDAPHGGQNNTLVGLYGHAEALILRPARLEKRVVQRWKAVVGAKIAVKVKVVKGGAVVPGAVVKWAGNEFVTNAAGEVTIQVPAGGYSVEAGKVFDNWFWQAIQSVNVPANVANFNVTLDLKAPNDALRLFKASGNMIVNDYETVGANEKKDIPLEPKQVFLVAPLLVANAPTGAGPTGAIRYVKSMGGEIRVEVQLNLSWLWTGGVAVAYNVKFFEGASESTTDLDGQESGNFTVQKDEVKDWSLYIWNKSESEKGDNATINIKFQNVRQG